MLFPVCGIGQVKQNKQKDDEQISTRVAIIAANGGLFDAYKVFNLILRLRQQQVIKKYLSSLHSRD